MFERIIDLLIEFVELFQFFVYVDEFEEAVVLRCGKYNRTIGPGAHWIIPFGVEDLIDVNVKPEPMWLDVQSTHTQDDYIVSVQAGVVYQVTSPKTFLVDNEDTEDIIAMLVSGIIYEALRKATWATLRSGVWLRGVKAKCNREARLRGAEIDKLVIQDLASGEANRLWVEGVEL